MSARRKVEPRPPGSARRASAAALRRVDAELRAFHAALLSLPLPAHLRELATARATFPATRDREDR
jgi:hypothetical protein